MEKDFKNLISTLQDSIFTWEYFSDFEKVKKNIGTIEKELNLLNVLIGKDNIEKEFLELLEEYPKVRKVLPILIAVRKNKIKEIMVKKYLEDWSPELKYYLFYGELTKSSRKELMLFFNKSGLRQIFENKNIKSVVDYVFGIEVGMDTNGRKNRTGHLMEDIVEEFISDFCIKNNEFEYIEQATQKKIKEKWGYEVKIDKNNRSFDFVIFNKKKNQPFIFEVNYYSGGGSKLKSVAGEFQKLHSFLQKQKLSFFWITDGQGWLSSRNSLEETYNKINGNIFNIENLKEGILDKLLK